MNSWKDWRLCIFPKLASRLLRKSIRCFNKQPTGAWHEPPVCCMKKCFSRRWHGGTDYIRPRHELDYTPAPDLFHDIFGHTPMITHHQFADFYQDIGKAAGNAEGPVRRELERIYWFTVEFGLIQSKEGLRTQQEYDVWHMQPLLFVIESFEQLQDLFYQWARKKGLLS